MSTSFDPSAVGAGGQLEANSDASAKYETSIVDEPDVDVDEPDEELGADTKYGSPIVGGTGSELGIGEDTRPFPPEPAAVVEGADPTEHIRERWDERTPHAAVGIETALQYAIDLGDVRYFEFFCGGWGDDAPDAVLGYAGETWTGQEYYMVLIFRAGRLVTAIPVSWLIVGGRWTVAACSSRFTPYEPVDEAAVIRNGGGEA